MKFCLDLDVSKACPSLPSRERGLKSYILSRLSLLIVVAPFAGAWIEIIQPGTNWKARQVAPFAGAWIEIGVLWIFKDPSHVAPFAGAWIEITTDVEFLEFILVAPFAGAWIEIGTPDSVSFSVCRSLRGSVD